MSCNLGAGVALGDGELAVVVVVAEGVVEIAVAAVAVMVVADDEGDLAEDMVEERESRKAGISRHPRRA